MKESNIAKIYAKAFFQLGKDANIDIADDLTKFTEQINVSNDLENLLFLDLFTADEKLDVFKVIADKLGLSEILKSAIEYLILEKRIGLLPLIFKEIIVADDHEKGFLRGSIEGSADEISENEKNQLVALIQSKVNKELKLDYKKVNNVSAGYKITVEDYQLDATIDTQLENFKNIVINDSI
jgi:F-type H+-transporting ATPase subunit delta